MFESSVGLCDLVVFRSLKLFSVSRQVTPRFFYLSIKPCGSRGDRWTAPTQRGSCGLKTKQPVVTEWWEEEEEGESEGRDERVQEERWVIQSSRASRHPRGQETLHPSFLLFVSLFTSSYSSSSAPPELRRDYMTVFIQIIRLFSYNSFWFFDSLKRIAWSSVQLRCNKWDLQPAKGPHPVYRVTPVATPSSRTPDGLFNW